MTLTQFIQQYGSYAQLLLQDPLNNNIIANVQDIINNNNLFQEIVQGTRVIVAAYSFPFTETQIEQLGFVQIPPYEVPVPTPTLQSLSNQLAQLEAKVESAEALTTSLQENLIGTRNFLLNAPYTVSFTDVSVSPNVFIAQISSDVDSRLTDGSLNVEVFDLSTPVDTSIIQNLSFTIINPNIQAQITIPLPDNAYLGDFLYSSINMLNQGSGTFPASISLVMSVQSVVSQNQYTLSYTLVPITATPVLATPGSFLEYGLNVMTYEQVGSGVGSSFQGEPTENFRVNYVQFTVTTTPAAETTYLFGAEAVFVTQKSPLFAMNGTGLSGTVALWGGSKTVTYDPGITWSSGSLSASGTLAAGQFLTSNFIGIPTYPLQVNGQSFLGGFVDIGSSTILATPAIAPLGDARLYFDPNFDHTYISENGGNFFSLTKKFAITLTSVLNTTVFHGLNTTDVTVAIYDTSGGLPYPQVMGTVDVVSSNSISISFATTVPQVRVVISG